MVNRYRHETCLSDGNGRQHSHAIEDLPVDDAVIAALRNWRDRATITLGVVAHTIQGTIGPIAGVAKVIHSHTSD